VIDINRLLQRLCDADIDFVIVGGFAATLHGSSLVTRDLDVCAILSNENVEKLRDALRDANLVADAHLAAATCIKRRNSHGGRAASPSQCASAGGALGGRTFFIKGMRSIAAMRQTMMARKASANAWVCASLKVSDQS